METSTASLYTGEDSSSSLGTVFTIGLMVSIMVFVGSGNCLVIIAIWKGPPAMWTANNFLILQLAVTDLAIALYMPLQIALYLSPGGFFLCNLANCTVIVAGMASTFALLVMTFDRWRSISKPLTYCSEITRRECIGYVLLIWTVPIIAGLVVPMTIYNRDIQYPIPWSQAPDIMNKYYMKAFFLPLIYMTLLAIVALNIPILRTLHHISKAIADAAQTPQANNPTILSRANLAVIKAMLLVVGSYCVLWLPYGINTSILIYQDIPASQYTALQRGLQDMFSLLFLLSSGVNPIIYALVRKDFKEQFRALVWCRQPDLNTSSSGQDAGNVPDRH